MSHPNEGLLAKAHRFFLYLGVLYGVCIVFLAIPWVQRHVSYQHKFGIPLFPVFETPERYGLSPAKTFNVNFQTPDNNTLGAWFVLSDPYYQQHSVSSTYSQTNQSIYDALRTQKTVLYFHGTAGTRAAAPRVRTVAAITSRLQANVFVVDYRGFGDSTGYPSERGIEIDAMASWNWLLDHGAQPEDILIWGHSLGTGIASKLAQQLALQGTKPRGVALLAPFTSFSVVIEDYPIFGFPLLRPIQSFPIGRKLIKRLLLEKYDTLSIIQELNVPVLLAHSTNDFDIPHYHSKTLMDQLLDPHLPPSVALPDSPGSTISEEEYNAYIDGVKKRKEARSLLVRKTEIPEFGVVEEFQSPHGKVVYIETMWGGHNHVGSQEGVQNEIGKMFKLGLWSDPRTVNVD
ncbi:hypothetical protein ABKN59_006935 [Abortiporus biennis]